MLTTNVASYPFDNRRGSYAGIIPDTRRRISAPTPPIFQRNGSRVLLVRRLLMCHHHSSCLSVRTHSYIPSFFCLNPRYSAHCSHPHPTSRSSCPPCPTSHPGLTHHGHPSVGPPAVLLA